MPAIRLLPAQRFVILRVVQVSATSIALLKDPHSLESFDTLAYLLLCPMLDFLVSVLCHCRELLLSKNLLNRAAGHRHELSFVDGQFLADLGQVLVFF